MTAFSNIETKDDLFKLLNVSKKKMTYLLYNKEKKGTENSYTSFRIEKRNGGFRKIDAPYPELKYVQKQLATLLWSTQKEIWKENRVHPNLSHAFEQGKSIITNSKIHRNKKYVLNLDLEDFFQSFHFGRVKGFFEKNRDFKVPEDVALTIAQLTCYKGTLPQGSPSSPIITNLICKIMDFRILKLAKKFKLDYSRYADDLTFSTNNASFYHKSELFLKSLKKEISRAGFNINPNKTRLQFSNSRQEVTGLIVNKKINVKREYYKRTRAMAHTLYKTGTFEIDGTPGNLSQLEGRFAYINQIDKYNNKLEYNSSLNKNNIEYQKFLLSTKRKEKDSYKMLQLLNNREKEYQKFMFYKYFYGNTKPTIFTEGKTDVRYLKAALKKLYTEYPLLISKKNNEFEFNVHFFKRGTNNKLKKISRFRYFFNLPEDGADSMKNLYNFFSDKTSFYPNYLKFFNSFENQKPSNPVILIFDNELVDKNNPLKSFINYISDDLPNIKHSIKDLKQAKPVNIKDNLYLVTHQLLEDNKKNEIEDLFMQETLAHKEGGKTFSKKGDSNQNYGKEIFSKYVLTHYSEINFDNFKPLLNSINNVIINYEN